MRGIYKANVCDTEPRQVLRKETMSTIEVHEGYLDSSSGRPPLRVEQSWGLCLHYRLLPGRGWLQTMTGCFPSLRWLGGQDSAWGNPPSSCWLSGSSSAGSPPGCSRRSSASHLQRHNAPITNTIAPAGSQIPPRRYSVTVPPDLGGFRGEKPTFPSSPSSENWSGNIKTS